MPHSTHETNPQDLPDQNTPPGFAKLGSEDIEMVVFTRYEHGNMPVRVFENPITGNTNYEVSFPSTVKVFLSVRSLLSAFYGHPVNMPFDRYFRLGKYRSTGRSSGSANLLQLLDPKEPKGTSISVHGAEKEIRKTEISFAKLETVEKLADPIEKLPQDEYLAEFFTAMEEDLRPEEAFLKATPELMEAYEKDLAKEFDRLEGLVGIDLTAKGKHAKTLAMEVRKLLFAGFAGKMLSQGYDPEDVLQEVYGGLLIRNKGKCPWDRRISTFGHYVHMVTNCVLTNYHRKESKRLDTEPIRTIGEDGTDTDIGQYGSCKIHDGSEIGHKMALEALVKYLNELPEGTAEAQLARQILPLVVQGYKRGEIAREVGEKPSLVSRALAFLRREVALWATESGFGRSVPAKYLCPA